MMAAMQILEFIKFCLPIPLFLCLLLSISSLFISWQNEFGRIEPGLFWSPVMSLIGGFLTLLVLTVPDQPTQNLGFLFGCFVVTFVISLWITLSLAANR